jgi:cation diffusion facilitator family transporter
MSTGSTKAVLVALGANGGIALAKSIAAGFTGSGALFSEALHSWADCINQILLLVGMKQAAQKPDSDHPMGYGKVSYFYSMCVGMLLFFCAGVTSIMHGIDGIKHPEHVSYLGISIIVLLIAVALEGYSLYGALKGMEKEKGKKTLWQWFRSTRQAELMVVAAEDLSALVGLAIALAALTLTAITHNPIFDAIGSVLIGILLVVAAFLVLREVKAMITGESVGEEKVKAMKEFLLAQPEVEKIYNLISIQWGNDIMVATKAKMSPCDSVDMMINNMDSVEERFQKQFNIKWSFFEPDNK